MKRIRLFQAGDLPGTGDRINFNKIKSLTSACKGLQAWTYTHKKLDDKNKEAIKFANNNGLTINLSANNLRHADELMSLKIGPVVVTLPKDANGKSKTPCGNKIIVCPAVKGETTCIDCGSNKKGPLCYIKDRKFIIGFPAHGFAFNKVSKMVVKND